MASAPVMHRRILYSGRVQGVGFRWSVKEIAAGYDVAGSVRNLPDGRVELLAGGAAGEVRAFLEAIAQSHLGPGIRGVEESEAPGAAPGGFVIR